ncbi:MAG: Fic family protein [Candidatus Sericytochromatia bacterium]|nr:Fic family protein [Candidatus Sericytochromatia bacterium]
MNYKISLLPPGIELETKAVLKKVAEAHRYLAELKGVASTIPNEEILINTLTLQEAKDSSAIENIITTHDELFKAELYTDYVISASTKEVSNYAHALRKGFKFVRKNKILSLNNILDIQRELEKNNAGFRKVPGTTLKNNKGEIVYTPPQDYPTIFNMMENLEQYINNDEMSDVDPLVKMAVIHHQFETIHPFYDGNGRTGRIINILYLVIKELLTIPVLYLSRYIIQNKSMYYELLQEVRDKNSWERWIIFILDGIINTSKETIFLVENIKILMDQHKKKIKEESPKIYSQDLINNLFRHPYTKIEFLIDELSISRVTATKYLDQLVEIKILTKEKVWKNNYYINNALFELLLKGKDNYHV